MKVFRVQFDYPPIEDVDDIIAMGFDAGLQAGRESITANEMIKLVFQAYGMHTYRKLEDYRRDKQEIPV
jgi:hypothetical protein